MKATTTVLEAALWIGATLILSVAGPGSSSSPALAPAPQREVLSTSVRAALHSRMVSHGEAVVHLTQAVVLLRYQDAETSAHQIVSEPKMASGHGGDTTTANAELPPGFFTLQDELSTRGTAVEAAAHAQDDTALAIAYGRLAETCVACHSRYWPRKGP